MTKPMVESAARVPEENASAEKQPQRPAWQSALREILIILAVAVVLAFLVKTFVFRTFYIPSESMEPTLQVSDRVAVAIIGFDPEQLNRGDVVVFRDDQQWLPAIPEQTESAVTNALQFVGLASEDPHQYLVKRVIGLPGDRVSHDGGAGPLMVNGEALTEPYLPAALWPSQVAFDVIVPAGKLWVMGDNRSDSADSRFHTDVNGGFVDATSVVGRANVVFWPVERWGVPA